jgi:hypothetical protein
MFRASRLRFRTSGDWQQTDGENGQIMSGETFTCCHCGSLVDVVFGQDMAMCDFESLPICSRCSIRYHSMGQYCPTAASRANLLERMGMVDEGRVRLLKAIGLI